MAALPRLRALAATLGTLLLVGCMPAVPTAQSGQPTQSGQPAQTTQPAQTGPLPAAPPADPVEAATIVATGYWDALSLMVTGDSPADAALLTPFASEDLAAASVAAVPELQGGSIVTGAMQVAATEALPDSTDTSMQLSTFIDQSTIEFQNPDGTTSGAAQLCQTWTLFLERATTVEHFVLMDVQLVGGTPDPC